jgi:hypothetical protein
MQDTHIIKNLENINDSRVELMADKHVIFESYFLFFYLFSLCHSKIESVSGP